MQPGHINKTFLIILLGILTAIGPFSVDMYLPGFQQIAIEFGVGESQVAFTLTSYFLGISIGQLIYGPLIDKYGRKKPLLAGLFLYTLAAFGCAVSHNLNTMIGMRLLQALGGAVGLVTSNAIVTDVFEEEDRARAFSSMMLVMGLAPLVAPSLGSYFIEYLNWRFTFYFLVIFATLVFALIFFLLPETSRYMHSNKLKIRTISADYLKVFKDRVFLSYTLAGSISMSILYVYISSASFVFMTVYGVDKAEFSIIFAINAAGFIAGSYINGVMTKYFNYIKIARFISVLLLLNALIVLIFVFSNEHIKLSWFLVGTVSVLFLTGFINPNTTAASLTPFTNNVGAASALGGAFRMGIGAVMAAAIGIFQGDSYHTLFVLVFILALLTMWTVYAAPRLYEKK